MALQALRSASASTEGSLRLGRLGDGFHFDGGGVGWRGLRSRPTRLDALLYSRLKTNRKLTMKKRSNARYCMESVMKVSSEM